MSKPEFDPPRVFCIGSNYLENGPGRETARNEDPVVFMKPANCLVPSGGNVKRHGIFSGHDNRRPQPDLGSPAGRPRIHGHSEGSGRSDSGRHRDHISGLGRNRRLENRLNWNAPLTLCDGF